MQDNQVQLITHSKKIFLLNKKKEQTYFKPQKATV